MLSLLAAAPACARRGTVTVLVDTTRTGASLEVFALPISPDRVIVALPDGPSPAPGTPRADSIRRLLAIADSVDALDERFQSERTALNDEALRLADLERHSAEYARRYDAHRARLLDAERLRGTRDGLHDRAQTLRQRLGAAAPPDDATRRAYERTARRTAFIRAADGERSAHVVGAQAGVATTIALSPGAWWIGVAEQGAAPSAFRRVDVRAGARDTVRLATSAAVDETREQGTR